MFNRKFVTETKLVNTKKHTATSINVSEAIPAPKLIDKIKLSRKDMVHGTVGAVAVYASVKTINTLSTIAVNYAPKKH